MAYLRPLTIGDSDRLHEIKSNPLNFDRRFTNFDTGNVTRDSIRTFLVNIINETNAIRLGICAKEDNVLIGSITLGDIDYSSSCCEMHIYIDVKYQGMGYGRSSLQCLLKYVECVLNLNTITLKVHKEHDKAIDLYKKIGFNVSSNEGEFLRMHLQTTN